MKNLSIIALAFVAFTLGSCKKEKCDKGTVRMSNNSNELYNVYIDGTFKESLNGKTFKEYDLPEGTHQVKAVQQDGYLFFPTVKETTVNVYGCEETEFIFP